MFSNSFQSGFISIFYSVGSSPLSIWNKEVKNGHIRRVVDDEVKSLVLEISGTNVATTYITCPQKPRASLSIKLPFLVMIIKNMKKYFTFEIQILDDKDIRRRFRVSNFQSTTKVRPFCTTMPIGLSEGWNQVQFNLADFTKRAYGSTYLETVRVQVHANVRIRRIYFSDTLYSEDEMPNEFKLFLPTATSKAKPVVRERGKVEKKPAAKAAPAEDEVPSGAPPSPIESPTEEGPLPTAQVEEQAEEPPIEEPPVQEELQQVTPTDEVTAEAGEIPAEEIQPAEGTPEGAVEGDVPLPPEGEVPIIEEAIVAEGEAPVQAIEEVATGEQGEEAPPIEAPPEVVEPPPEGEVPAEAVEAPPEIVEAKPESGEAPPENEDAPPEVAEAAPDVAEVPPEEPPAGEQ